MGVVVAIVKVVGVVLDVGLATAQVVDNAHTKYQVWQRKRRLIKAIEKASK